MNSQILKSKKIFGSITALVTPFLDNKIDVKSLEKLIQFQLDSGTHGLVINGTTAESPTLNTVEVVQIFQIAKKIVGDRIPLILGTGSNSTTYTVEMTQKAEQLGADAALVVVPYYNKPPQRGLVEHFKTVAMSSSLPIIAYNVPGRTITQLSYESILELSHIQNIIGIKEASGDLQLDHKIISSVDTHWITLSGDDPTYLDFLKLNGHGLISVMSNLIPKECSEWYQQAKNNQIGVAQENFKKYEKLIQLMYCESNPIPVKWMLYKRGLIQSPEMRLPLSTLDQKYYSEIETQMRQLNLTENHK